MVEKKEKKQNFKSTKKSQVSLQEMTELLQRKQAELENYRKQTDKRMIEMREFAVKEVVSQILPVLDNFELALKNTDNKDEFVSGVELIKVQLLEILQNNGVEVIETKEFNPYLHEALMKVESELPENAIVEELQKGFMLNGKVVRHAKVKISDGKKDVGGVKNE